jgi:hypothetical protein
MSGQPLFLIRIDYVYQYSFKNRYDLDLNWVLCFDKQDIADTWEKRQTDWAAGKERTLLQLASDN